VILQDHLIKKEKETKMLYLRIPFLLAIELLLGVSPTLAANYAVGTCKPSLPSYTTISAAVSGVPPGSTSAKAQSASQNQKSDNKAPGSSQAQRPSEGSKVAENESAPAQKERAGGPQEGIKVHGYWVIDVRNPDGKLITHREFENSYSNSNVLPMILARQVSTGLWTVLLIEPGGLGNIIFLTEPQLSVSVTGTGLTLMGSATAPATNSIVAVGTQIAPCPNTVAPANPCTDGTGQPFTSTSVSPIPVATGQIIQVTVTISFS
jgi:hypothetical protein